MLSERTKIGLLLVSILLTVLVLWLLYSAQFGGDVFAIPL